MKWAIAGFVVAALHLLAGIAGFASPSDQWVGWVLLSSSLLVGAGSIFALKRRFGPARACWILGGIVGLPLGLVMVFASTRIPRTDLNALSLGQLRVHPPGKRSVNAWLLGLRDAPRALAGRDGPEWIEVLLRKTFTESQNFNGDYAYLRDQCCDVIACVRNVMLAAWAEPWTEGSLTTDPFQGDGFSQVGPSWIHDVLELLQRLAFQHQLIARERSLADRVVEWRQEAFAHRLTIEAVSAGPVTKYRCHLWPQFTAAGLDAEITRLRAWR